ncbi:MBL fold metallo-hydrolase [Aerococcus kribbianus]|uniref:MBL fold metallo-hydrolase n=1 Tax=Aerococcus kribbianus TaxID=2999064 RepID=A0A9X3JG43_9LACT|nr:MULTISPECIES: MBL fold metallo-hydrolase [unclassified Aerococcus]MCZ0716841.1 MBL fold metallo-hydrolase [Aerococcus sp. YH-aer221]MCZ0725129.1 MBL fold metallo-hydrolase [Aerococcus sp. YH-aer222]
MNQLTVWSGLTTIGCNIMTLHDQESRLIMDFGMANDQLEGRNYHSKIAGLIAEDKLPGIPYLYNEEDLEDSNLAANTSTPFSQEAVFISHLHLDHMQGLKYLPDRYQVYMTEASYQLYQNLIAIGDEFPIAAQVIPVPYNQSLSIGKYMVKFIPTDHDIPGSSAIYISHDHTHVLYSGDFRFTGFTSDRMENLIKEKLPIDILLCEGTAFSFDEEVGEGDNGDRLQSEHELLVKTQALFSQRDQAIVINPYPRNLDRLMALNEMSLRVKRPIAWDKNFAYLLHEFTQDPVYSWDPAADSYSQVVEFNQRNHYAYQIAYQDIDQLDHIGPGLYLHMNGEPLGDFDPRYQTFLDQIASHGYDLVNMGVSGHANKEDLVYFASEMQADITIPWHSFHPKRLASALEQLGLTTFVPEIGAVYDIEAPLD